MVGMLAFAWLVPYLIGFAAYSFIVWIPFLILELLLIPNLAKVVIPPRLEDAYAPNRRTVLRRNVEVFTLVWLSLAYFLVANAGMYRLIGEKNAFAKYFSVPLGWFDPVFKVQPENSPLQTLGIFLTNNLVSAVFAFPFAMLLRAVLLRARRRAFTLLDVNSPDKKDDDD